MAAVHLEDIVCRCLDHLLAFGEDDCLQNVYELGNVGHLYALAVLVEDVEVDAGDECISDSILLIEEARVGSFFNVVPCAPLIDHETDPAVRIVSVHDGRMLLNELFHRKCLGESHVPFFVVKARSASLVIPVVRKCVIVERQAVHVAEVLRECSLLSEALAKKCLGPVIVFIGRTYGKFLDLLVLIVVLNKCLVLLIEVSVVLGDHVAAAAPCLVAYCKVVNCPGLLPAIGSSEVCHWRYTVKGHILYPFAHLSDCATADITVNVCLASELLS